MTLAANSTTTTPFTISAGYDKMDRVTSVVRPGGRESDYAYDGAGELLTATDGVGTPLVRASHYTYDPNGNRLTASDPLGHISSTSYDKTNRPLSMADALTHATTLTYDANGQVKTLTDPNANVTTWTYDDAGRKIGETDPNNKSTTYNYDDANRLTKVTDRIGRVREYHYDAADQMDGEKWYLAASPSSIVKSISYGHDANGNLTSATDALSGGGNPNFDVTIAYVSPAKLWSHLLPNYRCKNFPSSKTRFPNCLAFRRRRARRFRQPHRGGEAMLPAASQVSSTTARDVDRASLPGARRRRRSCSRASSAGRCC